jgi:hypothetical protein
LCIDSSQRRTTRMKNEIKKYLAKIGGKGGKAGTGASKRRSREHYRQIALKRWAAEKKGGKS